MSMLQKDVLLELYVNQGLSIRKVATATGYSPSGIRHLMVLYQIPIRSHSESQTGARNHMHGVVGPNHPRYHVPWTDAQRVMNKDWRKGALNPMYGKKRTDLDEHFRGVNNPFYGKRHSEETLAKMRKSNPLTVLKRLLRHITAYKQWRMSCFVRDGFACIWCGSKKDIQVDHIKQFAVIIEEQGLETEEQAMSCMELWDLSNGRTLCSVCHKTTPTHGKKIKK